MPNQTEANKYSRDQIARCANDNLRRIKNEGRTVEAFDVIDSVMVGISVWGYDLGKDTFEITQLAVQLMDEQGVTLRSDEPGR